MRRESPLPEPCVGFLFCCYSEPWIGYKVYLTETCEADQPHLIIDVHTTCAAVSDAAMTGPIHRTLAARGLLPSRHLVDSGYIDANLLVIPACLTPDR